MKKVILFLIVGVFSLSASFANETELHQDNEKITIKFVQTDDEYKKTYLFEYDSFEGVMKINSADLKDLFDVNSEDCMVTATVSVTSTFSYGGDVGVANSSTTTSVTVTAQVTASCSGIGDAVKKLVSDLRNGIGAGVK